MSQKNIQQIIMHCCQVLAVAAATEIQGPGHSGKFGIVRGRALQVVTHLLVWKDMFKVCYGRWKERNTGWHVGYPHFMMMCWRPQFDVRRYLQQQQGMVARKQNKDGFR